MRDGKKEYNNQRWLMGYGEGKRRGEEIAMMIAVSGTTSMTTTYCRTAAPAVDASLVLLLLACLTPEATNVVA